MTIEPLEYFFDNQQRRFLEQIVRAFSVFQWKPGMRNGVEQPERIVPCRMAVTNRMVGHILRNLSENTALTVPLITVFQTGIKGRREDIQSPSLVENIQVVERRIDNSGAYPTYTGERGNSYTVQRVMPKPFQMEVQVDIWTSNLEQKYQLSEQILTDIYPSFDIQNSDNPIDWTACTTSFIEDMTFSSRSIPIGTDSEIDIMTITIRLPIWLNAPVKVTKRKVIEEIITNINDIKHTKTGPRIEKIGRNIVTPGNCHVSVDGDTIKLLNGKAGEFDKDGNILSWITLINEYGELLSGQSQIRLLTTDEVNGPFISGTLYQDGLQPNQLIWQINPDTLPSNTLTAITGVVDPLRTAPGVGLPNAVNGNRYLLLNDIGNSSNWPGIQFAHANDIIEYSNGLWTISFASLDVKTIQYVLNIYTTRQLRWTGKEWGMSIDGTYSPGYWRLVL